MQTTPESLLVRIEDILDRNYYRSPANDPSISGLSECMRVHGQKEPGSATREGNKYRLTTGMRRLEALRMAGATHMWLNILPDETSVADRLEECIISDTHRKALNPVQLSESLAEAMAHRGCSAHAMCKRVCYSDGTISRLRQVGALPEEVKEHVRNGTVALSTAYEVAKAASAEQQIALADIAAKERLTREEVRARVSPVVTKGRHRGRPSIPKFKWDRGDGNVVTLQGQAFASLDSGIEALTATLEAMRQARAAGLTMQELAAASKEFLRAG